MNKSEYDYCYEDVLRKVVEDTGYVESPAELREQSKKLPSKRPGKLDKQADVILMEADHAGIKIETERQEELLAADHRFLVKYGQSRRSYIPRLPVLYKDATGKLVTKESKMLQYIQSDPELTAIMARSGYDAATMEWERQVERKRWQLFKPRAPEREPIEPVCNGPDWFAWQDEAVKTLPPAQRKLTEMVAEYLPDPPKPSDKAYPRYDARRLKDPNKLRRSSGMPRNKMYGTIGQSYEVLLELARCKRYAVEQGLDYVDGKPFTTPKPFNKLAYLLERKPFGDRPTMPPLGTNQTVKTLAIGNDTIPVKWKTVKREPQETQVSIVSELLKPRILQKGAWSPHHINPGHIIETCGKYAKDALLMVYGWLDRRNSEANNPHRRYFNKIKPVQRQSPWPTAWVV